MPTSLLSSVTKQSTENVSPAPQFSSRDEGKPYHSVNPTQPESVISQSSLVSELRSAKLYKSDEEIKDPSFQPPSSGVQNHEQIQKKSMPKDQNE